MSESKTKLTALREFLFLPEEITEFERDYLAKLNRVTTIFFALHLPVFMGVAYLNDTGWLDAIPMTLVVLAGPVLASRVFPNPRHVSLVHGFTAMIMGGLLVHFGQGPVQIEMHFYFFALLAMLAAFGNPLVIVTAAVTVALHHLGLWYFLPESVFNYDAPIWVVLVHAAFVVLESFATCFIAKSFHSNVIGLEKIVAKRTEQLEERNRDMDLILGNVVQGLATLSRDGTLGAERSAAFDRMLEVRPGGSDVFAEVLRELDPDFGDMFELGFEQLQDGFMPTEVSLALLPDRVTVGARTFAFAYAPIGDPEEWQQLSLVVTDVTAEERQKQLEAEQRDLMTVFECMSRDRTGVGEFMAEATVLVESLRRRTWDGLGGLKRTLHTLKGNASIFGFDHFAHVVHELEDFVDAEGGVPTEERFAVLFESFGRLRDKLGALLGDAQQVDVDDDELRAAVDSVLRGDPARTIANRIASWRHERAATRLARIETQLERLATRLGREVEVELRDHDLRLDPERLAPFWSAFVHVVRNTVDHGIEDAEERTAAGKPATGHITLSTERVGDELRITVRDDGRGIDWDRVRAKAERLGLPTDSQEALTRALFAEGLSTREKVTQLSGRGVGLTAVAEACDALGGAIHVESERGVGTTMSFVVPWAEPAAVLVAA